MTALVVEALLAARDRLRRAFDEPILILTADMDWASEACITQLIGRLGSASHPPTLFATNPSREILKAAAEKRVEVGLHPNFRAGSTHGETVDDVFDHVFAEWPMARWFRSHSFMDGVPITAAAVARKMEADCNALDFLMPFITPQWLCSGLWRFSTFWEDDVHWSLGLEWDFARFERSFMQPGLKVINVHPLVQAFNVSGAQSYARVKHLTRSATEADIALDRERGAGSATFLNQILEWSDKRVIKKMSIGQLLTTVQGEAGHCN